MPYWLMALATIPEHGYPRSRWMLWKVDLVSGRSHFGISWLSGNLAASACPCDGKRKFNLSWRMNWMKRVMYETEELRSLKWPFSHVISADAYPILENHCEALEQDKANCLVLPLLLLNRSLWFLLISIVHIWLQDNLSEEFKLDKSS